MVKISFINNGKITELSVPEGTTILEAAHQNAIPLEGACEGSLACSTCHVVVGEEWYAKLPKAKEDEEDMLDLAFGLTKTSRLGCQITLNKDLDGISVTIPESA